ncbi:M48 family metallopeptidase [Desulfovibrio ferrophilus]|uniref:Peptidase M48 Ste24p n=1 Tax=Desulfovibrio ferrophilus TaxID=241368 RepID=A0A2Z6B0T2_9BACT|nr:M48 family metallopeptidase [Desulfovibrio ferrophilus]BBD09112.1 peptidase M48 Ste24p [Desulfovibrio ferrophilus]
MKYTPRLPETNVNVSPGSPIKDLLLMLAAASAIVVGIYVALGFAVDKIAPHISYETELAIGGFLGKHPILKNASPAPEAIQKLAETIRTRSTDIPFPVTISIREDPQVNAFAVPGGQIVLTTGILDAIESENELAFILGHELGHIAHRDHLRGMGRGLVLLTLSSLVLDAGDSIGGSLGNMVVLTELTFTRRQETLADEAGQDALMSVFGHITGAEQVFSHFAKRAETNYLTRFALSHPETQSRIQHLRNRAKVEGFPAGPLTPLNPEPQLSV